MRRVGASAGRRSGGGGGGAGKGASSTSSRRGAPGPSPSSPPKSAGRRPFTSAKPKPKPKPSSPEGRAFEAKKPPPPSAAAAAATTVAAPKRKKKPASAPPPPPPPSSSSSPPVDTHKTFDEALITVRAGAGGRGEISQPGSGTWVRNFKFKAGDGKSSRQIFLPSAEPARGGEGGSVVLRADPSVPDLLHLRYESYRSDSSSSGGGATKGGGAEALKFTARDGRQGDAAAGSNAPRAPGAAQRLEAAAAAAASANSSGFEGLPRGPDAPPLVLRVPLGTVVKRSRGGGGGAGGALVGELLSPGQTLVVARGGRGGTGVVAPRKGAAAAARARAAAAEAKRQRRLSGDGGASFDAFAVAAAAAAGDNSSSADPNSSFLALEEEAEAFYEAGADEFLEDDDSWRLDAKGEPGEGPVKLRLLLRVVADVGLVGAPNAGKSSMLAALTRARPEVAAYPFTTLRPNLGVLAAPLPVAGKGGRKKKEEEEEGGEGGEEGEEEEDSQPQQTTSFVFGGFEDEVEEEEEEEDASEDQLDIDEEFAFGGRRRASRGGKELERDPLKRGAAGAPRPVLADLPGLIEGAASGRGLGRAFLRHLRRARVILHMVDASTADPVSDYAAIRKELALYNPDYLSRPHVVALNKADLFFSSPDENAKIDLGASPPIPELAGQIRRAAAAVFEEAVLRQRESDSDGEEDEGEDEGEEGGRPAAAAATSTTSTAEAAATASLPHSVVWTSADSDLGLEDLRRALSSALASTAGQPAPGGARSSQRAVRKARRAAAQAAFEASEGRRGSDYAAEELEW